MVDIIWTRCQHMWSWRTGLLSLWVWGYGILDMAMPTATAHVHSEFPSVMFLCSPPQLASILIPQSIKWIDLYSLADWFHNRRWGGLFGLRKRSRNGSSGCACKPEHVLFYVWDSLQVLTKADGYQKKGGGKQPNEPTTMATDWALSATGLTV